MRSVSDKHIKNIILHQTLGEFQGQALLISLEGNLDQKYNRPIQYIQKHKYMNRSNTVHFHKLKHVYMSNRINMIIMSTILQY